MGDRLIPHREYLRFLAVNTQAGSKTDRWTVEADPKTLKA